VETNKKEKKKATHNPYKMYIVYIYSYSAPRPLAMYAQWLLLYIRSFSDTSRGQNTHGQNESQYNI